MKDSFYKDELRTYIEEKYGFDIASKIGASNYYKDHRSVFSCDGFSWFTSRKIKRILFGTKASCKVINILGNMCLLISMLAWVAMLDTSHGTYKWPSMNALNRIYVWSICSFITLFVIKIFLENRNFRRIREKLFRTHRINDRQGASL